MPDLHLKFANTTLIENKIKGTPILKLVTVKENLPKKTSNKSINTSSKNSSKKWSKNFDE